MEDSFEEEVMKLWENESGNIFSKLERFQIELVGWVRAIKQKRNEVKRMLSSQLK